MTPEADVFLGVIAVATFAIAIVQIGIVVAAALLARRMSRLVDRFEQELRPLFGHLNAIGRDASQVAALAAARVEMADQMIGDLAARTEQTLKALQSTLGTPAREGRALLSAFRAGLDAIRELRQNPRARQPRGEDDEALFI